MSSRARILVAVAVISAALGAARADAQTTTTPPTTTPVRSAPATGSTSDGNARAAAAVRREKLTGAAGSGLTRGVSASAVKVSCYLQAGAFAGAESGYRARFQRANTTGELPGGRKVELGACIDDGGNAQTNLQVVQRIVDQDQAFAAVGLSTALLPQSTDYFNTHQVPYVGWGFLPGFCHTRWGYGFNGCLVSAETDNPRVYQSSFAAATIAATQLKPSQVRVALQAADDDAGRNMLATLSRSFELAGAKVVYAAADMPLPGPPASFDKYVAAVLASKPNLVGTLVNVATAPAFSAAVTASGYTGLNFNMVGYNPGLLAASAARAAALNGTYPLSQVVPQESQTAYIKQMEGDLTASGASTGKYITLPIALAYAQADVLVSMLKAVGPTLDTKTWDDRINRGSYTYRSSADGGPGQMEFPAMHHIPADCVALMAIQGASYAQSVPFACYASRVVRGARG